MVQPKYAELGGFLTRPNGVVLSRQVAQKYGLAVGDRIALQVKGAPTTVTLVGLLTPADEVSNQKLSDLIIADNFHGPRVVPYARKTEPHRFDHQR